MLARDLAAEREPIETITDRAAVKVKTSDRRGALCGVRFAPHRNPDHFEECPACADALGLLRTGATERPDV